MTENNALHTAILERGVFYFPAGAHYGNPAAAVTCDRCRRTNISASIGFDRYDYCLPCVEAIIAIVPANSITRQESLQMPRHVSPTVQPNIAPTVTAMRQDMFRPSSESYMTLMAQDLFRADLGSRLR
jgi:hypothetical protein